MDKFNSVYRSRTTSSEWSRSLHRLWFIVSFHDIGVAEAVVTETGNLASPGTLQAVLLVTAKI